MSKKIKKVYTNNSSFITADDLNEIINVINDCCLKIDYMFYKETDIKKAAEIMAEILGNNKINKEL